MDSTPDAIVDALNKMPNAAIVFALWAILETLEHKGLASRQEIASNLSKLNAESDSPLEHLVEITTTLLTTPATTVPL